MSASWNAIMEWTPAAMDKLRTLWDQGISTAAIGKLLGTSKNSVVSKANRLNLTPRPSLIKDKGSRQPSARNRKTVIPAPRQTLAVVVPVAALPVVRVAPRLTGARTCQFIAGEPRSLAFCGAPVERGSYCGAHALRCYQSRAQTAERAA